MNPFFFGSASRALYGTYHPPQVRAQPMSRASEGVVLCPPFGVEYMRSHRAFRQLTTLLTRGGFHVLRFDYGGTGDSAGDGLDATTDAWVADVRTAIQELQDTAGIEEVTLLGLRLGGAMALEAARGRPDVRRVILWDPVADGELYLREILKVDSAAELDDLMGLCSRNSAREAPALGVSGFPLPRSLSEGIRSLRPGGEGLAPGMPVEVVASSASPHYEALRSRIAASGVAVTLHVVPSEGDWAEGDAFGSALLPQGIIQHMVDLMVGSGAGMR